MTERDEPIRRDHVKVSRKFFESLWWKEDRPKSKAEAWLDIIYLAAWRPRKYALGYQWVLLQRGEFVASQRFLAERWHWSRKAVRNFLTFCQKEAQLRAQQDACGGTVYLVVNYDAYQSTPDEGTTQKGPAKGQVGAQQGPKTEAIQSSTASSSSSSAKNPPATAAPAASTPAGADFPDGHAERQRVLDSVQFARIATQVPDRYRVSLEGALRAARNPAALLAEIEAIANGLHLPVCTYAQIGQALHELAVANVQMTARTLRGFCRKVVEADKAAQPKKPQRYKSAPIAAEDRPTGPGLMDRFKAELSKQGAATPSGGTDG